MAAGRFAGAAPGGAGAAGDGRPGDPHLVRGRRAQPLLAGIPHQLGPTSSHDDVDQRTRRLDCDSQ